MSDNNEKEIKICNILKKKLTLLFAGGSQSAIFRAIVHHPHTVYGYGKLYVKSGITDLIPVSH